MQSFSIVSHILFFLYIAKASNKYAYTHQKNTHLVISNSALLSCCSWLQNDGCFSILFLSSVSLEDEIWRTVLVGFGGNVDLVDLMLLLSGFKKRGLRWREWGNFGSWMEKETNLRLRVWWRKLRCVRLCSDPCLEFWVY